ncbi:hypothetical protein DPV73_17390 [Leptospira mayottensis]|nr:hypothetical protein DPV73_17390 [Leptospira mayottensis]
MKNESMNQFEILQGIFLYILFSSLFFWAIIGVFTRLIFDSFLFFRSMFFDSENCENSNRES